VLALLTLLGLGSSACSPRPSATLGEVEAPESKRLRGREAGDEPKPDRGSKTRWQSLSIGTEFGCALENSGAVYCWGRDPAAEMAMRELPESEQVANPYDYNSQRKWGPASRLENIHGASALDTSNTQACAVVEDGRVRCWGAVGWSGRHIYDVAGFDGATSLAVGDGESCGLRKDDSLWCWSVADFGVPTRRMEAAVGVVVRDNLGCGLDRRGGVRCWGSAVADWYRYRRQITQPSTGPSPTPGATPETDEFPDSAAIGRFPGAVGIGISGWNNLCLVMDGGGVLCSERDVFSALDEPLVMRKVDGLDDVAMLASSRTHNCAVSRSGGLKCWGRNIYGQLGDGTATQRDAPVVVDIEGVVDVSLTQDLSCAVTTKDEIECWGFDLGEAVARESTHVHTIEGLRATSLASAGRNTCAVTDKGELRCWGADSLEGMGIAFASTPTEVALDMGGRIEGLMGGWQPCFLGGNGALYCGARTMGTSSGVPPFTLSSTTQGISVLANGVPPMCIIKGEGRRASLLCGAAPDNLQPERQIKAPSALSARSTRVCVAHSGGKVSCFGELYQWADQAAVKRDISLVRGVSGVRALASANSQDCALTKDGRVSCWMGRIDSTWDQQTHRPTKIHYTSEAPKDVGLSRIEQVVGRGNMLCAVDRDGAVTCWYDNPYSPDIGWAPVPEELGEDIVELSAGDDAVCARHKDGRVTCWGEDSFGQLGRVPSRVYLKPTALPVL